MIKYQQIIDIVDPRLSFEACLGYNNRVYKVGRRGVRYVLKTFPRADHAARMHVAGERAALLAADRVNGITGLVKYYGSRGPYVAVLKEFADGTDLRHLDNVPDTDDFWNSIAATVKELHVRGIASLDISGDNIVAAPDKKRGSLVDLGTAKLRKNVSAAEFSRLAKTDLDDLYLLSGRSY